MRIPRILALGSLLTFGLSCGKPPPTLEEADRETIVTVKTAAPSPYPKDLMMRFASQRRSDWQPQLLQDYDSLARLTRGDLNALEERAREATVYVLASLEEVVAEYGPFETRPDGLYSEGVISAKVTKVLILGDTEKSNPSLSERESEVAQEILKQPAKLPESTRVAISFYHLCQASPAAHRLQAGERRLDMFEHAQKHLEKALLSYPNNVAALYELASILALDDFADHEADWHRVAGLCEEALEVDPELKGAQQLLKQARLALKER